MVREAIGFCLDKGIVGNPENTMLMKSIMKKDGYFDIKITIEEYELKQKKLKEEQELREFKNSRIMKGIDEADDMHSQFGKL